MTRSLRLEFAGALYHVTSRGDGQEAIYRADGDRRMFLDEVFLGSEAFAESMKRRIPKDRDLRELHYSRINKIIHAADSAQHKEKEKT